MNNTAIQVGKLQFITTGEALTFDGMDPRRRRLLCAAVVGWTLGEPMRSVEVVSSHGRVAIVSVDPFDEDPILPVVLAAIPGDWRGHLCNWYHHQLNWQWNRDQRKFRKEWLEKGQPILSRLLAHARGYLTPDEFQFMALELAAVLVLPDEPR